MPLASTPETPRSEPAGNEVDDQDALEAYNAVHKAGKEMWQKIPEDMRSNEEIAQCARKIKEITDRVREAERRTDQDLIDALQKLAPLIDEFVDLSFEFEKKQALDKIGDFENVKLQEELKTVMEEYDAAEAVCLRRAAENPSWVSSYQLGTESMRRVLVTITSEKSAEVAIADIRRATAWWKGQLRGGGQQRIAEGEARQASEREAKVRQEQERLAEEPKREEKGEPKKEENEERSKKAKEEQKADEREIKKALSEIEQIVNTDGQYLSDSHIQKLYGAGNYYAMNLHHEHISLQDHVQIIRKTVQLTENVLKKTDKWKVTSRGNPKDNWYYHDLQVNVFILKSYLKKVEKPKQKKDLHEKAQEAMGRIADGLEQKVIESSGVKERRKSFIERATQLKNRTDAQKNHYYPYYFDIQIKNEEKHLEKVEAYLEDDDPYRQEVVERRRELSVIRVQWEKRKEQGTRVGEAFAERINGKAFYGVSVEISSFKYNPELRCRASERSRSSTRLDDLIGPIEKDMTDSELGNLLLNKTKDECWELMKEDLTQSFDYMRCYDMPIDAEVNDEGISFSINNSEILNIPMNRDGAVLDVEAVKRQVKERVLELRNAELKEKLPRTINGMNIQLEGSEHVTLSKTWDDGREAVIGQIHLFERNVDSCLSRIEACVEKQFTPDEVRYKHYEVWLKESKTEEWRERYSLNTKFYTDVIGIYEDRYEAEKEEYNAGKTRLVTTFKPDDISSLDRLIERFERSIGNQADVWKTEAEKHNLKMVLHHTTVNDECISYAVLLGEHGNPVAKIKIDAENDADENGEKVKERILAFSESVSNALHELAVLERQPEETLDQFRKRLLPVYQRYYDVIRPEISGLPRYKEIGSKRPPRPNSLEGLQSDPSDSSWINVTKWVADEDSPKEVQDVLIKLRQTVDPVYDPLRKELKAFADGKEFKEGARETETSIVFGVPNPPLKEGSSIQLEIDGKRIIVPVIMQKDPQISYKHLAVDEKALHEAGYEDIVRLWVDPRVPDRFFLASDREQDIKVVVNESESEARFKMPDSVGEFNLKHQPDGSVRVFKDRKCLAVITDVDKPTMQIWIPEAVGERTGRVRGIKEFSSLKSLDWFLREAEKARKLDKIERALIDKLREKGSLDLYHSTGRGRWNNEATGKKLQLDGWRRNGVMGFDLLTKEGNNPGYLQLELNDSKDGYDIVLYWNTGTGSEKLKTYRNFEHFEKDALLQLMYKDNSNSLHYIWKEKVLDLDVGHRIYIHRGIEVNKNQTGTLNLSWDSDLYPARSIGRGVASYNAPIRFEVDKITDDNGDLILHFKGKIVGKIDSAYFIRDGGETYRVNVKKYDAKNKEWTEYATLELPPI